MTSHTKKAHTAHLQGIDVGLWHLQPFFYTLRQHDTTSRDTNCENYDLQEQSQFDHRASLESAAARWFNTCLAILVTGPLTTLPISADTTIHSGNRSAAWRYSPNTRDSTVKRMVTTGIACSHRVKHKLQASTSGLDLAQGKADMY